MEDTPRVNFVSHFAILFSCKQKQKHTHTHKIDSKQQLEAHILIDFEYTIMIDAIELITIIE